MKGRPLVALSSAAIVAVYTAGYVRTRAAADRFDQPSEPRRPSRPIAPRAPEAPRVEGRVVIPPPATAPVLSPRTPAAPRKAAAPTAAAAAPLLPPSDVVAPGALIDQVVQELARPDVEAPPPEPPAVARGQYKDGSYTGWGSCRHGDIQASVVVDGGRIVSAKVVQCLTRYSCNWIEPLYPQVAQRQNAEVDYISGASESSDAFHDAVAEALAKAK
jgi:uncharacterized protein with FMN-binding domain